MRLQISKKIKKIPNLMVKILMLKNIWKALAIKW